MGLSTQSRTTGVARARASTGLALSVLAACAAAGAQPQPRGSAGATGSQAALVVELRSTAPTFASGADVRVDAVVTNRGAGDADLVLDVWDNPILAAEVVALPAAQRVPTLSPPVPPVRFTHAALHAGASRTFHWRLNMFAPPLPPGRYRVLLRDRAVPSTPAEFAIQP
jgi:hypothetical protein